MWIENEVFRQDLESINQATFIHWKTFEGKTIFVTGGTGLIGYMFISSIMYRNMFMGSHIGVIALVRDQKRARVMFKEQIDADTLTFVEGTIENLPEIKETVDYIVHTAGPTQSGYFLEKPVETVHAIVGGVSHVLQMAREKHIQGMTYLSSMEVYGASTETRKINEDNESYLNTMVPRNSYPEAKRIGETLCAAYHAEYGVPVNVLRLTQTFGPGIAAGDSRVFAQFINACRAKKDIVLLTEGKTKRSYLYLADAVTAIFTLLDSPIYGEAYNVANEKTYCSIRDMAEIAIHAIGNDGIKVCIKKDSKAEQVYLPEMKMDLDTSKLKSLGWSAKTGLAEMFKRTEKTM